VASYNLLANLSKADYPGQRIVAHARRWLRGVLQRPIVSILCMATACFLFGSSVSAQDFVSPTRLASLPSGQLLVADIKMKVLLVWELHPEIVVRKIDVPGRPVSVAYGWSRLFVGNEVTQTVDVLNMSGKLLYTLGGDGLYISRPSDIALDVERELVFVTDPGSSRVLVFNRNGTLVRTLPAAGQTPLYQPTGIVVDPVRSEVLVSDFGRGSSFSMTAAIHVYDYNGMHLRSISGNRADNYSFSRPQGLALNDQGLVYVVDSLRGQVLVFNRDTAEGVTIIGELGQGEGQLMLPLDVHISKKTNAVYVTNNRNRRIEVYDGKGVLP